MESTERDEFCEEISTSAINRGPVLRAWVNVSQQMVFFTAGEKEVRFWMVARGTTAEDAAGSVHADLAP